MSGPFGTFCPLFVISRSLTQLCQDEEDYVVKDQVENVAEMAMFQISQDAFLKDSVANDDRFIGILGNLEERNVLIQQLSKQQHSDIRALSQGILKQKENAGRQQSKCSLLSVPLNELAGFTGRYKVSSLGERSFHFFFFWNSFSIYSA
jgi:hypothetical protein